MEASVLADFDHDGAADALVVATNPGSGRLTVLRYTNGALAELSAVNLPQRVSALTVGDLNGDSLPDIVTVYTDTSTATLVRGNVGGGLTVQGTMTVGSRPVGVALGDVNKDGKLDLAVGNDLRTTVPPHSASVLLGTGTFGFNAWQEVNVGQYPAHLLLTDLTGDGFADLVTLNAGGSTASVRLAIAPVVSDVSGDLTTGYDKNSRVVTLSAHARLDGTPLNSGVITFTIRQGDVVIGTPVSGSVSGGLASTSYRLPAGLAVGTYTVEAAYSGTGAAQATATLTVEKAVAVVTLTTDTPTVYGQSFTLSATLANQSGNADLAGLVAHFFVDGVERGTGQVVWVGSAYQVSGTFALKLPAGLHTVLVKVDGNASVKDAMSGTGSHRIDKAALDVTPDALRIVYGQPVPVLTCQVTGLAFGEAPASVLDGALQTAALLRSAVGDYAIGKGTLRVEDANYALRSFTPGTLTIAPRPVYVTAANQTKVYGNNLPTLTFTIAPPTLGAGLLAGDRLTGAPVTLAGPLSDVGSYAITQGSLAATSNYDLHFTAGTLEVTRRPLFVTALDTARMDDESMPPLPYRVVGLVREDEGKEILSGSLATATELSAGHVYPILQGTLAANSNYEIRFVGARFTYYPLPLRSVPEDHAVVYRIDSLERSFNLPFLGGIAVTEVSGEGTWFYRVGAVGPWRPLGQPSEQAARLLRGIDYVRFVPAAHWTGSVRLVYHLWNRTFGGAGQAVSLPPGTARHGVTFDVTPVNDAPTLPVASPLLSPIGPADANPAAIPVSQLLTVITDAAQWI